MSTFYIVRHGHSQAQENDLMPDKYSPLSTRGIRQAKERGKTLQDIPFAVVFSSHCLRAYQTALYILLYQKKSVPLFIVDTLGEKSWARFEGKKHEEINREIHEKRQLFLTLSDKKKLLFKYIKEMESDEEAGNRFIKSLKLIHEKYPNSTMLVSTHGTIMKTFLIKTTDATYMELPSGSNIDNTGYLIIDFDGNNFTHTRHIGVHRSRL